MKCIIHSGVLIALCTFLLSCGIQNPVLRWYKERTDPLIEQKATKLEVINSLGNATTFSTTETLKLIAPGADAKHPIGVTVV